VLAAAIGLNAGGATQVWVAHGHPSSHHEPSPEDKDLTKKIRAGFKAALPNVEFKGHLVCGRSGFSLA
jgi:DNA repair protein RadC